MTASPSIPPITPTPTTTDTTNVVVVSSSSVGRSLYHTIRTASPPPTPPPLPLHHDHQHHHHMHNKKRCIDPPGRNSDAEEAQDDDDDDDENQNYIDDSNNNVDEDDRSFDWSSISSVDDHDHQDDDDVSMTDPVDTNITPPTPPTPPTPRRKVTFGMMEIYEVPSLSEYRMEDNSSFWYTSMDMISTRRAGRLATMSDASVKNYLYHYEFLYKKLQNDGDYKNAMTSPEPLHLSEFDTKILAYGLRAGYQGLEREGPFEKIRQDERRGIVKRVVQAHWSLKQNHDNNDNNLLYREEAVRSVAIALTHHMSVWAASLGQAAHFAMD